MNETDTSRDPAAIEQDIRRTQDEMSRTVDKIGGQLSVRNIVNSLFDKTDGSGNIDTDKLLDQARRNPLALALIAGGAIWLVSDSDAKVSSLSALKPKRTPKPDYSDPHHRDYVSHMERVEWREGEDHLAYQRRRDLARANYLMVERRHDEDDTSFRDRLDQAAEKFRERRHAWAEKGGNATSAATSAISRTSSDVASRAQDVFTGNPLLGGLAAAAVGALFGSILPITETEEQKLAGLGEKARDLASEQTDKLAEAAREKKDNLVQKAESTVRDAGAGSSGQGQGGSSGQMAPGATSSANDDSRTSHQLAASQPSPSQTGGANDLSSTPATPSYPGGTPPVT